MPISKFMADKWDARLYNWVLWLSGKAGGSGDARISSVYRADMWRQGAARVSGNVVVSGEAVDTDKLMVKLLANPKYGNRIWQALFAWGMNYGTRGAQAQRLSIHEDTYKDWVDSGKRELERLARAKSGRSIKSPNLSPERV